jgi:hypothetical protein
MDSQWTATTAIATVVTGAAAVVYTFFTLRLWQQTKRQAETATRQAEVAERQAVIAQRMLDAAHRPWLSIALHYDAGSSPNAVNLASVFTNHGTVPATVTKARLRGAWEGKEWADGERLVPTGNPANLCIFPGETAELGWGIPNLSYAPWPKGGFLRTTVEITYRGAFEGTYETRIETSAPFPEGNILRRSANPMDVVRAEAT